MVNTVVVAVVGVVEVIVVAAVVVIDVVVAAAVVVALLMRPKGNIEILLLQTMFPKSSAH